MDHEITFVARDHHYVFYMNQNRMDIIENIRAQKHGVILCCETFVSVHVCAPAQAHTKSCCKAEFQTGIAPANMGLKSLGEGSGTQDLAYGICHKFHLNPGSAVYFQLSGLSSLCLFENMSNEDDTELL